MGIVINPYLQKYLKTGIIVTYTLQLNLSTTVNVTISYDLRMRNNLTAAITSTGILELIVIGMRQWYHLVLSKNEK